MTSADILIALTRQGGPFCRRRWIAVPRVYWGWGLRYEADLIAVSRAEYCTEVEIKVSRSDLRADRMKKKWELGLLDDRIHRFYYAVPVEIQDYAIQQIPDFAGLITVHPGTVATAQLPYSRFARRAKTRNARKPTTDEILKLLHLGTMRYWDLILKESPV